MYDQLGGGFHRYSVGVPCKMLLLTHLPHVHTRLLVSSCCIWPPRAPLSVMPSMHWAYSRLTSACMRAQDDSALHRLSRGTSCFSATLSPLQHMLQPLAAADGCLHNLQSHGPSKQRILQHAASDPCSNPSSCYRAFSSYMGQYCRCQVSLAAPANMWPAADPELHIPHFEKMLYDNPQLAATYLDAFACTKDPELAATARSILDYLLQDMRHASGAFFSAEVPCCLNRSDLVQPASKIRLCSCSCCCIARSGRQLAMTLSVMARPLLLSHHASGSQDEHVMALTCGPRACPR